MLAHFSLEGKFLKNRFFTRRVMVDCQNMDMIESLDLIGQILVVLILFGIQRLGDDIDQLSRDGFD